MLFVSMFILLLNCCLILWIVLDGSPFFECAIAVSICILLKNVFSMCILFWIVFSMFKMLLCCALHLYHAVSYCCLNVDIVCTLFCMLSMCLACFLICYYDSLCVYCVVFELFLNVYICISKNKKVLILTMCLSVILHFTMCFMLCSACL